MAIPVRQDIQERIYIKNELVKLLTKAYSDYVYNLERALCADNDTPFGFTYDGKSFGDLYASSIGIKDELKERAEEIWVAKSKLATDQRKIDAYLGRVMARLKDWGQMYDVIPDYLHDAYTRMFVSPPKRTPQHLRLIVYLDIETKQIMDFHVMFRLVG